MSKCKNNNNFPQGRYSGPLRRRTVHGSTYKHQSFFYCFFLLFLADLGKKIERCAVGKIGPKGRFSCQFRQENTAWSKSCPKGRIFLLFLGQIRPECQDFHVFSCFFMLFWRCIFLLFLAIHVGAKIKKKTLLRTTGRSGPAASTLKGRGPH